MGRRELVYLPRRMSILLYSMDQSHVTTEYSRQLGLEVLSLLAMDPRDQPLTPQDSGAMLRLARTSGVAASVLVAKSGLSRAAVYNRIKDASATVPAALRAPAVLAHVAAAGPASPESIAGLIGIEPVDAGDLLRGLAAQGTLIEMTGYYPEDPVTTSVAYFSLSPAGDRELEDLRRDLLWDSDRPSWIVYLGVPPDQAGSVDQAAREIASGSAGVIDAKVTNITGSMVGPELGVSVHSSSQRAAIAMAQDVWGTICAHRGKRRSTAPVMAVSPPTDRS
jgi:hypothetical protein